MTESVATGTFRYRVGEARGKDVGRAYARLDPEEIAKIGAKVGDLVEIVGKKTALAKLMPSFAEDRSKGRLHIDGILRENAGVGLDEPVEVRTVIVEPASRVVLQPTNIQPNSRDLGYLARLLEGVPVLEGCKVRATLFGRRSADFTVKSTAPSGPVIVTTSTRLELARGKAAPTGGDSPFSYEDIGGVRQEIRRVREIIELPLRYPEVFERLGIDPPKGVLLHGPPGCGKTLIARAVAHETEASFYAINGPEIIHKFYGESEAHLRKVFDEAEKNAPSIVFLDELDAIAPKRENAVGEVEKRVVAQLLGLMDGLSQRKNVVVIAATNIPNALDPALRRPGRFDREICIRIPDKKGREEILEIHARGMPLADEVDIGRLAEITHGFVGADLAALCREAAMSSLRRIMPEIDFAMSTIPYDELMSLEVLADDFADALRNVSPSAIREVFVEVPDVSWDDIGGLEESKKRLREAVEWPLQYAGLFARASLQPPKGILLSGPPGCGKTLLAKAVARESKVNFISIKGPALLSKYVGESGRAVREVFSKARQAAPCIILFDEIDSVAPRRSSGGSDSQVSERVLGQILTELDGVEELRGVLVLGATNRPDMLDPALLRPGRFDLQIEIEAPDEGARTKIFEVYLRRLPLAAPVSAEALSAKTDGFTGADIEAVCKKAAMAALREVVESGNVDATENLLVSGEHLEGALEEVRRHR